LGGPVRNRRRLSSRNIESVAAARWRPPWPAFSGLSTVLTSLRRTRARPATILSSGGNLMSRYFATFDRRTRQRCILARAEADLQWQQCPSEGHEALGWLAACTTTGPPSPPSVTDLCSDLAAGAAIAMPREIHCPSGDPLTSPSPTGGCYRGSPGEGGLSAAESSQSNPCKGWEGRGEGRPSQNLSV
jgi:hypothetical protein